MKADFQRNLENVRNSGAEKRMGAQGGDPAKIGTKIGRRIGGTERRDELLKGPNRCWLRGVDLACGDGCNVVVFAADGRAGKAAEHGELAGVGEGVGDGPLEEAFDGRAWFGI